MLKRNLQFVRILAALLPAVFMQACTSSAIYDGHIDDASEYNPTRGVFVYDIVISRNGGTPVHQETLGFTQAVFQTWTNIEGLEKEKTISPNCFEKYCFMNPKPGLHFLNLNFTHNEIFYIDSGRPQLIVDTNMGEAVYIGRLHYKFNGGRFRIDIEDRFEEAKTKTADFLARTGLRLKKRLARYADLQRYAIGDREYYVPGGRLPR